MCFFASCSIPGLFLSDHTFRAISATHTFQSLFSDHGLLVYRFMDIFQNTLAVFNRDCYNDIVFI